MPTTRPPVSGSVTNAAGAGRAPLKSAARLQFTGGALAAGADLLVGAVVTEFRLRTRGDRTSQLLLTVRADLTLTGDQAWIQVGERIDALTAALRAAGLASSRFLFAVEPD